MNTRSLRSRRLRSVSGAERMTSSGQAAALQAASIAQVLATPCQNTNLTPTQTNLPLVRGAVLCLINTERAQHGEEPLQSDRRLEAAAESHGKEMLAVNYFDHISPSGVTPVERVREAGYFPSSEVGYVVGENLAWGTLSLSTPEAIVKAWIASPEHLANILEAKYRDTGIDVQPAVPQELAEGVEGGLYTQEFGVIVG
ncbi:MAG TPA: CAP domain-containing protein [Solirubrobacteraceae bacterium]